MSTAIGIELAERGLLPDAALRWGIRRLLKERLGEPADESFLEDAPVAPVPEKANEQHYEVPAAFYRLVLGRRMKYSSALWPEGVDALDAAEDAMLDLTCERADLADGQRVLELGCGWGSLTLQMAERYPASRITAVSNSASQRAFIEARAPANVEVITADMNGFEPEGAFDRVVSVEMFEHMRDHRTLMARIARWLAREGKLFVHVFCHRSKAYPFETDGADNWMGRHFFTGGVMPSEDLLPRCAGDLALEKQWRVDGTHYAKTAEAWLRNLDHRRDAARAVLAQDLGSAEARRQVRRWRIFFLACAELFGYRNGEEWFVAHYRWRK